MFTGIVTDLGKIRSIEKRGDTRIEIETSYDMDDVDIGSLHRLFRTLSDRY